MKAKDIIREFCKNVFTNKPSNRVFPNIYHFKYESDILEVTKAGYLYEYEVKISKQDFKQDFKKSKRSIVGIDKTRNLLYEENKKHDELKDGKYSNYFYFITPENLVTKEEIPDYAGLIYVKESSATYYTSKKGYYTKESYSFRIIKPAPLLHKNKVTPEQLSKMFISIYYRYFYKLEFVGI